MSLRHLKLRYKLLAIPVAALIGFAAIAMGTERYSSRLERAMDGYEAASESSARIARLRADLISLHATLFKLVSFTGIGDSQKSLDAVTAGLDRQLTDVTKAVGDLGDGGLAKDLAAYSQWVAQTRDMLAVDISAAAMFIVSAEGAFKGMLEKTDALGKTLDAAHQEGKKQFSQALSGLAVSLYVIIAVSGAACLGLSLAFFRPIMGCLRKAVRFATRVAEGNFDEELDIRQNDEIGVLADSLRAMVRTLKNRLGFARGIQDGITAPCLVTTPEGRIAHVNQQMIDLIERTGGPADYLEKAVGEFFYPQDPQRPTITGKCIAERKTMHLEAETVTVRGNTRQVRVDASPIFDLDGQLIGAMAVLQDYTEIREKQRHIEDQNARIASSAAEAGQIAEHLASMARSLAQHTQEASSGAESQKDRAHETAAAMNEMSASVLEVAKNAGRSAQGAEESIHKAREGVRVVEEVIASIGAVSKSAEDLMASMQDLGRLSSGIGQVLAVISDIADQTNLLALNAAIEAARAGEAGRGFAVVADEVRKLAEKTMQATKEVGQAITDIQSAARRNLEATDRAAAAVNQSTELAQSSGEALRRIVELVQDVAGQIREIATAAEEQSAASEQINQAIGEIRSISQGTSETMAESTLAVQNLHTLASRLNDVMEGMNGNGSSPHGGGGAETPFRYGHGGTAVGFFPGPGGINRTAANGRAGEHYRGRKTPRPRSSRGRGENPYKDGSGGTRF